MGDKTKAEDAKTTEQTQTSPINTGNGANTKKSSPIDTGNKADTKKTVPIDTVNKVSTETSFYDHGNGDIDF